MRRFITLTTSMMLVVSMLMASDVLAQSRSTGNSTSRSTTTTTTTQQSTRKSSNTSVSRSSGSSTTTRSTGTTSTTRSSSSAQQSTRSTGTTSRSTGTTSTTRSSSSAQQSTRSTGTTNRSTGTANRSTGTSTNRSTGTTTRSTGTTRSYGTTGTTTGSGVSRSVPVQQDTRKVTTTDRNVARSAGSNDSRSVQGTTVRSSNVSRSGLTSSKTAEDTRAVNPTYRDNGYNYRYSDDMRVDDRHNMYRIAPRHRDAMAWDRPGCFWGDHPHYYGYRIHSLPPSWRRIHHWGIDYYYYNGIYYRPFGGVYVVCRPPFGTPLEAVIDRALFGAVRFAYYCDTYRTYSRTFDYYNIIARQNLIIAQQNARLMEQNASYALNSNRALTAYELADRLGLVQSYAYANSEYFYQDGVFYTISASGVYSTIVPPAGALVTSLPDDYEVIVMNGIEYYLVDNTVYRTTLFDGQPYLEVLGQMYGSLYNQYNVYR